MLELYLVYIDESDIRIDITIHYDITMEMSKEVDLILEKNREFELFSKELYLMGIIVLY